MAVLSFQREEKNEHKAFISSGRNWNYLFYYYKNEPISWVCVLHYCSLMYRLFSAWSSFKENVEVKKSVIWHTHTHTQL